MPTSLEENPYRAPEARVEDAPSSESAQNFYVVSPRKFLILMIGTLNLYQLYWFYKHWSQLNSRHKSYWPVLRAIFAVFFTHSLFGEIDRALIRRGAKIRLSPSLLATVYVVSVVISAIASQIGGLIDRSAPSHQASVVIAAINLVLLVPVVWALYRAQCAANVADGDPDGETNSSITAANIAWLIFGGVMWALTALGWYAILTGQVLG